ncbi:MAG: hypothetical protein D8M57_00005 [Candidatus Scalindua sp. AMX11]|nr:MAG: hypothetical protein DWQ00_18980 [Candidatus Scalindua sp.]NOG84092.1 hypothetical protein [Planctomycetota bacterium]RZV98996.1 MAG: hypothetical protein EX341_00890 [Candidatus Scalindua sp. SCAELEC01]TDE66810.1 MAG: hypothetical protein D8M57_00005 [Candidatus Scalindua sp. AMX11]GJQ57608.1 MAG: hypothetical protein SCALA701_04090 [Candidatus Scalindua sp.]
MKEKCTFYIGIIGFIFGLFFGIYGMRSSYFSGKQALKAEQDRNILKKQNNGLLNDLDYVQKQNSELKTELDYVKKQNSELLNDLDYVQKQNEYLGKVTESTDTKAIDMQVELYKQGQQNSNLINKVDTLKSDSHLFINILTNTSKIIQTTNDLVKSLGDETVTLEELEELKSELEKLVIKTSGDIKNVNFDNARQYIEGRVKREKNSKTFHRSIIRPSPNDMTEPELTDQEIHTPTNERTESELANQKIRAPTNVRVEVN